MSVPLLTAGTDYVYHAPAERLLRWLPDNSIDLIVTSPPYDNLRTYKGFTWDFEYIARQSYRVLKSGGVLVWVVGDQTINGSETLNSFRQALHFKDAVGFNVHDTMIYWRQGRFPEVTRYWQEFEYMFVFSKGTPQHFNPLKRKNKRAGEGISSTSRNPDGSMFDSIAKREGRAVKEEGDWGNIWYFDAGYNKSTKDIEAFEHPATYPELLAESHILTWSNPGDVVLDFFMGSGTTAKMARNNGRRYIGCDIAAEYVTLTNERLAKPYNLQLFAEVAV